MIYTLVGPSYLVKNQMEELILENHFQEEERFTYDLEETSLFSILENSNTISFLSPKKVVLLKNAFFLEADQKRKMEEGEVEAFLAYLDHPNEDVLFLLSLEKFDERKKKLVKAIQEKTKVVLLKTSPKEEIERLLKGYELENGVLEILLEALKNEEVRIPMECEKLKIYRMETKKILKEDVQELVRFALPEQEETVFAFSRSLASRDKKEAYQAYRLLEQMGVDTLSLMGLLESQFRTLYQVKALMEKGYSKEKIASRLGYHPYRVQKTQELARFFSKKSIRSYLLLLEQYDYEMKSGKIDSDLLIDLLIMRV